MLARLGTSDPIDPTLDADALAAAFDLPGSAARRRGSTMPSCTASMPP
jgi:hypothetical protein